MRKEAGDYTERQGITQKPTTTSNLHCIAITHSWINTTNWFFKVLSRMNAEDETWVEKENCYGDHIRAGTFRVREIIYQETGKSLMQVAGALSKSGGSTDGNDGREFFTLAFLPIILKCIPEKYHDTIKKLHRDLSCILRVISSTSKVNWHAFEKLTQEASILLANELSWVRVNRTLHGVLHHSCELIRMNEQCGLGMLSEEALEANNKYVRRYLETKARLMNPSNQMEDVLARLLERSDPLINNCRLASQRFTECNVCGSCKHTTLKHDKALDFDAYDRIVHDILIDIASLE